MNRHKPNMARPRKPGLVEAEGREQGLRVLARMIAQVYTRDTKLARKLDPEHCIPYCGGTKATHSEVEKAGLKKDT